MGSTGWITVLMGAAILLPGLLLLFARGVIHFGRHPKVVAFHQRIRASREEHRLAWTVGLAAPFLVIGFLEWWFEEVPISLLTGMFYVWVFTRQEPAWMRDAFPEDLAGWSEEETAGTEECISPAASAPPIPTDQVWSRPDRPPSASELRRRARGQKMGPADR